MFIGEESGEWLMKKFTCSCMFPDFGKLSTVNYSKSKLEIQLIDGCFYVACMLD